MTPIEIKYAIKHICQKKRWTVNSYGIINTNVLMFVDDPDFIKQISDHNPETEHDVAEAILQWQSDYYAALELSRKRNSYIPNIRVLN